MKYYKETYSKIKYRIKITKLKIIYKINTKYKVQTSEDCQLNQKSCILK